MKLLILTADNRTLKWETLDKKLAAIKVALNSGKNANFSVEIEYKSVLPKIDQDEDRINTKWLEELTAPYFMEYDIVAFHFSKHQRTMWGIQPSLRGLNPKQDSELESVYFWSDEDTLRLGYSQFTETLLHEICHSYFQQTKLPDITHKWHEENKTIVGLLTTLDWSLYQPRRMNLKAQKNLLERIVGLLTASLAAKKQTTLLHPVEQYKHLISQQYGEPNEIYTQTKHHIGTDYACPVGTPVKAPWDGEVTVSGNSPALGNFCHYKYTFDGVTYVARFMHLSDVPPKAKFKRGEIIELSGKTGKIDGPHLHVDVFFNDVRVDLLTEKNFRNFTLNPQTHYVTKISTQ